MSGLLFGLLSGFAFGHHRCWSGAIAVTEPRGFPSTGHLNETGGSTKSVEALLGGSAEVAAADYWVLINVAGHGQPVRGFVLPQKLPGFAVIVSTNASKQIQKIEDLKGQTIGFNAHGNAYHRVMNRSCFML